MIATKTFHSIPIAATSADDAVVSLISAAVNGPPTTFRLVNAGTFDAAMSAPGYMDLLRGEGVNLPDGRPLTAVMQLTAPRDLALEQVRGPWLFEAVLAQGRGNCVAHFLLGSSEETLKQLADSIVEKFPGVIIAGTYSPPYGPRSAQELQDADALVVQSGAHVVWVALGTPKQDAEALRITRATGITTAAVGAAFDFTAGTKRAAPKLVRRAGLEWLFRLVTEPRRLWRRYLVGNTRFLILSARHLRGNR